MMDLADTPWRGDYDGRGNLSQSALIDFSTWFFEVCLDQGALGAGHRRCHSCYRSCVRGLKLDLWVGFVH